MFSTIGSDLGQGVKLHIKKCTLNSAFLTHSSRRQIVLALEWAGPVQQKLLS